MQPAARPSPTASCASRWSAAAASPHSHFEAVRRHAGRAELVAVCDTDPAALAAAVQATGAQGFASLSALLAGCERRLRGAGHAQRPAPAAGDRDRRRPASHVMTEKPMATRWRDGLAMVRACDEAGVRLFVVKQNRRNRTLQLLKRAIDQGRFGRIYMVTVNVFWTRPQATTTAPPGAAPGSSTAARS